MPKAPNRLECENISFTLGASETSSGHRLTVNFGFCPETGRLLEIAFCEAGKIGQGIHLLLAELGIRMSRYLQERDPETGAEPSSGQGTPPVVEKVYKRMVPLVTELGSKSR